MTRALVVLVALALACPAASLAEPPQTNAPPGNSGIDEYLETVPGASGNKRPRPPGQGGAGSSLSPALRARLERQGADGKALANAIDATSSGRASNKDRALPQGDGDGGGIGLVLPAILILVLLTAILAVLFRRLAVLLRRRATS